MRDRQSVVVQKFGGTSLGTTELIKNAALKIARTIKNGEWPIVVASAMAGVTNNLVKLAKLIGIGQGSSEYDVVLSSGEQIASGLLTSALNNIGIKSRSMLSWQVPIITHDDFGTASIVKVNTSIINECIKSNIVPVIAGFQGITNDNRMTTLGRGGSDLTAIAVSAALFAKRCDIFTDVDGVYTADPRIVQKSQKISFITYELMIEMASYGAKVLQEQSVKYAMEHEVPIHVASSFKNEPGTIVKADTSTLFKVAGITSKPHECSKNIISIIGDQISTDSSLFMGIKQNLEAKDIAYSFIDGSLNRLSFIIDENNLEVVLKNIHTLCGLDNKKYQEQSNDRGE